MIHDVQSAPKPRSRSNRPDKATALSRLSSQCTRYCQISSHFCVSPPPLSAPSVCTKQTSSRATKLGLAASWKSVACTECIEFGVGDLQVSKTALLLFFWRLFRSLIDRQRTVGNVGPTPTDDTVGKKVGVLVPIHRATKRQPYPPFFFPPQRDAALHPSLLLDRR